MGPNQEGGSDGNELERSRQEGWFQVDFLEMGGGEGNTSRPQSKKAGLAKGGETTQRKAR